MTNEIEYERYEDWEGVHRQWVNEFGITQRELIEPTEAYIESRKNTWERTGLRSRRDSYLASTDWMLFTDSPLSEEQKEEAIEYRQMLRDLPQNFPEIDDAMEAFQDMKPQEELSWL